MIRKLAQTFRHIVVILVAVGVVTFGAYAFSTSSLASSLSEGHGSPPAAMITTDTNSAASDIVLVDAASSDPSAVASNTQTAVRHGAPMGEGDRSGGATEGLTLFARNISIILSVSTVVALIQTVLKRHKRNQKLTMAPA